MKTTRLLTSLFSIFFLMETGLSLSRNLTFCEVLLPEEIPWAQSTALYKTSRDTCGLAASTAYSGMMDWKQKINQKIVDKIF